MPTPARRNATCRRLAGLNIVFKSSLGHLQTPCCSDAVSAVSVLHRGCETDPASEQVPDVTRILCKRDEIHHIRDQNVMEYKGFWDISGFRDIGQFWDILDSFGRT